MSPSRDAVALLVILSMSGCAFIHDYGMFREGQADAGLADGGGNEIDANVDANIVSDAAPLDADRDAGPCMPLDETCNGTDDDCDTAIDENPTECGAPGSLTACVADTCSIVGCAPGMADCDDNSDCELDVSQSRYLCGGCEASCAGARELCNDTGCQEVSATWGLTVETPSSSVEAIAAHTSGAVIATGYFHGIGRIGATSVDAVSGRDSFVISLDGVSGSVNWLHTYAGTDDVLGYDVAVASNHIYVAGEHRSAFDVGDVSVPSGTGTSDVHLVQYSLDGTEIWVHDFTITAPSGETFYRARVGAIEADTHNNVYIALDFAGTLRLNGGYEAESSVCTTYVASFDSSGNKRFATSYEGCGLVQDMALHPMGEELHLLGQTDGMVTIGGESYGPGFNGIRVIIDPDDGTFLRAFANGRRGRSGESACDGEVNYVAGAFDPRAPSGPIIYTGVYCDGTVDFGSPALESGVGDIITAHQGIGDHIRYNWRTSPGPASITALAFGPRLLVVGGGGVRPVADFGLGSLGVAGESDAFLAAYQPDGTVEWATTVGGPGYDIVRSVAIDRDGVVFAAGSFRSTFSFGSVVFPEADGVSPRGMIFRVNN